MSQTLVQKGFSGVVSSTGVPTRPLWEMVGQPARGLKVFCFHVAVEMGLSTWGLRVKAFTWPL